MSEYQNILKEEFQDEEYRYAYAEDYLNTSIATQIKVLREQRELTQQELAAKVGTKQAGVSRLENVNYSAWKTQTLRKIARALGVRLKITFETFGTFLDEAAGFSRETLERPDFADDPAFQPIVLGHIDDLIQPAQKHLQPETTGALEWQLSNVIQMPSLRHSEQLGSANFAFAG
jgi:transcriptional regulator with XRE-family HTH domain